MSISLSYDTVLNRVQISGASLAGSPTYAVIDRTTNNVWTTVRGGEATEVTGGAVSLDDYEFPVNETITYRIRAYNVSDTLVDTETDTISQELDDVWFKSIARPFLNRTVYVKSWGDIQRPSRMMIHDVIGRSYPVAVTEIRGSRQLEMELMTRSVSDADQLELMLASGDVIYIQVPSTSNIPSGYFAVGNTTQVRTHGLRQYFMLPLTEVAPPAASIVGTVLTWSSVIAAYADWTAVVAGETDWNDLLDNIGSPDEIVVP